MVDKIDVLSLALTAIANAQQDTASIKDVRQRYTAYVEIAMAYLAVAKEME